MINEDVKYGHHYYYLITDNITEYSTICYVMIPKDEIRRNYYYSRDTRWIMRYDSRYWGDICLSDSIEDVVNVQYLNYNDSKYLDYLTILNKVQML